MPSMRARADGLALGSIKLKNHHGAVMPAPATSRQRAAFNHRFHLPVRRHSVLAAAIGRALQCMPLLACAAMTQAAENLEEVTVLGQGIGSMRLDVSSSAGGRLGLSALETPASTALITRDEIDTKGDYDILSAVTRSTGFSTNANPGNGGTSMSVRGFSGPDSIATLYDGTHLYVTAGTVTFPADSWTIEQVDVLRGASSVINGMGAIGATVNYVPKSPKPGKSAFDVQSVVGSFDMRRIALGGGTDLGEDWAFRLDGAHQESDSNVDRNSKRRNVAAGSLLFHPTDDFSMKFSVDYADIHEDSPYFGTPLINGEAGDEHRENNYNFADGFSDYEDIWTRLHTEWRFAPGATFRNDTYVLQANREWQNLENYAYDDSTGLIERDAYSHYGIIHDQRQVGTRTDVLLEFGSGALKNKLTVGGEFNKIDLDYSDNWADELYYADSISSGNASVPVFGWRPDTLADDPIPTVLDFSTSTNQLGLFIDDVLEFSPQWSLVAGLRFDRIRYRRDNQALALSGRSTSSFDSRYSEWSGRAGVVYQPFEGMSVYAQYSRATDPVTSPASMSSSLKAFDPTRGRQYEVGVKQQLMTGRAEYTLAWFDISKTDLVTRIPGSQFSEQIGEQGSNGIEATLRLNPTQNVSIDLNATWVDAQFDEYYSDGVSLAGNQPSNVPRTTANAWINWAATRQLSVGAGARYVVSRFADSENTRELPAYTVVDARAGWSFTSDLQMDLRVRNLTDERDQVISEYAPNQWIFGDPRTYEISFTYSL